MLSGLSVGRTILKLNNRGFSLIEISSAVVLISILSVFSVTQYNRQRTKSLTKEAQLQLGHLQRMERLYFIENNTFTFELKGNMFPKGTLLYNVGFGINSADRKLNPCAYHHRPNTFGNNYYELCGDDLTETGTRQECGFKNKHGFSLSNTANVDEYQKLKTGTYYKSNHSCNSGSDAPGRASPRGIYCDNSTNTLKKYFPGNENRFYTKFIAYAVGDVLDPNNFSSPANKLDVWRINGNGYLEHCQNPLKTGVPSTCNQTMGKTEDDSSSPYCG